MDPQIVATMNQTIYVASATGADAYGQPTWGAAASRLVTVEPSNRIVPGPQGEQLQTSTLILTDAAIGIMDRVWLPGDSASDATKARRIMLVDVIPDELSATTSHWEVYL